MSELGKPFRKSDPKKTVKIKVKLPHVNKKTTSKKANVCSNTFFSLYFKIRAKKIHAAKPLDFSLHFLFRRDQNHYSNSTSKIMKMCEQILKKTAPKNNSNYLNCKKWEHNNSRLIISSTQNHWIVQTYTEECRKIAAVDSHNQDWERTKDWDQKLKLVKIWFSYKKCSSVKYFDVILELNILLFRNETTQGLVSIPISIEMVT